MLKRFERATNAKINKTKTEALWVGGWRNRMDKPLGLKWKKDHVKFLGVYVGNMTNRTERVELSNLNFEDINEKITKKNARFLRTNFWENVRKIMIFEEQI